MTRITKTSLPEEVANRIRRMIRKGVLKKGDRIIEHDLSETLGVSRTPLREALRSLTAEGLIELRPHRGAYVAEPSMDQIQDMFEVMSFLEGLCARITTEKASDSQIRDLERLHDRLERHHRANQPEKYLEVNEKFHTLLQELVGNQALNEVINGLREKVLLYRYRQLYQPRRFEASMNEHKDLMAAIRERRPADAEHLMRTHLMNQCEALKHACRDDAEDRV
ncbi:MAG: GntR family transcriptional regulator [Thermodesulfobacteriota bacterium]